MKFGTDNFEDLVSKAIDIEKALEQQAFSINNINAVTSSDSTSHNSLIQVVLRQQAESNKMLLDMQEQLKKLKEERNVCNKLQKTRDCWYFLKSYAQGTSQQGNFSEQFGNFSGQGSSFSGNDGNFSRQDRNFARHDRNQNDNHVPKFNRDRDRRNHRSYYRNQKRSLNQ